MLGGADNTNGELLSYIIGADTFTKDVSYHFLAQPVISVKQPPGTGFGSDEAPLFIHFRADNDISTRLYPGRY